MVEEEMEIEQMKMDLKKKTYEMIDTIVKCQERAVFVKLFKPTTTKFEGTLLDQFRFWNSFEIEIDKVDINSARSLTLKSSLGGKYPNTEFFSVPNTGKYGPEKTLYLDTFHAVAAIPKVRSLIDG